MAELIGVIIIIGLIILLAQMVFAIVVFLGKVAISLFWIVIAILAAVILILVSAVPLAVIIYVFFWATNDLHRYIERKYVINIRLLAILLLTILVGVAFGGMFSSTWLRLSISSVFITTVISISGATLSGLLIYPYIKYFYAVSAYRKREQHLIKP